MNGTTVKDNIRQALLDAINWQAGIVDAYKHMPSDPAWMDAVSQIARYKAILRRRYGKDETDFDSMMRRAKLINILDPKQLDQLHENYGKFMKEQAEKAK
jgi:hypothetical protein